MDDGARGIVTCAGLSALRRFLGEVSATLRLQLLPVGASLLYRWEFLSFTEVGCRMRAEHRITMRCSGGAGWCKPGGVGEVFGAICPG